MLICVICTLLSLFVFRLIFLFMNRGKSRQVPRKSPVKTCIIIGSGGHTSEMLRLVTALNFKFYTPRLYVMADTDTSSEVKIKNVESEKKDHSIVKIPRSRAVNQSYFSSVWTTLHSIIHCVPIIIHHRPSLILCNGPGTCVPICALAFLMNVFYIKPAQIVFVESICRVETLSLTGKILYWFADSVIVQWPQLTKKYKNSIYLGRLV